MSTRRRVVIALAAVAVAGAAFTIWQVRQMQVELERAEDSVAALRASIEVDDPEARDEAIADFQDAAGAAQNRSDGLWWAALTHTPIFGDDAEGVRVLSAAIHKIATDGVGPLVDSLEDLDRLTAGGGIDLQVLEALEGPVEQASTAFSSAAGDVDELDPSGYIDMLSERFVDLSEQVDDAARSLRSANTALQVLPDMLGAEGPRDYLLLFQNNAEIRATGGMPGSWALVHAAEGQLAIEYQGTAGNFPMADEPVMPLTDAELALYGPEIGTYFQDPGFTPDFPRAADLWNAHWKTQVEAVELDGVLAIDPVALSYILEGTGPVTVDDVTLTQGNAVEELLSNPYLELEPADQDVFFSKAARAIFDAATGELASPVAFVEGLGRAAREGRFLVASFDEQDAQRLEGSAVLGAMPTGDSTTPYVDIGLNDTTGSKMSYYLRYRAEIKPTSCAQNRQSLSASISLNQSIRPDVAAELPVSVTGGGLYGTEPGNQLVSLRIYGPAGGTIDNVRFGGEKIPIDDHVVDFDGRPALTLAVSIDSRDDLDVTWSMTSGEGQTGDIELGMTPNVVPGGKDATFQSACPQA